MNAQEKPKSKKLRPRWVKILYSIFKKLIIPVLCLAALFTGLWFGYVYMGGRDAGEIWNWSTWKHLYDLVFAS